MATDSDKRIVVEEDGPYEVYGEFPWCARHRSSPNTASR